jgi:hypothetical protein
VIWHHDDVCGKTASGAAMMPDFDPRLPEWDHRHGLVLDRSTLGAILEMVWGFLWRYVCAVVLVTGWAIIEEYLGLLDAIGGMEGPRVPVSPSFFVVFLALTSAVEVLAVVAALSILMPLFCAAFAALPRRRSQV